MYRGYGCLHILNLQRRLGRYRMLGKVIVQRAPKEDPIDEEIKRNRFLIPQYGIYEA